MSALFTYDRRSEDMVGELTKYIKTNRDCADVCAITGSIVSRHTDMKRS